MNSEETTDTWTVLVVVRVPRDDGPALVASTRRRLEASRGVEAVEHLALCDIEPGLSATIVRVEARITGPALVDGSTVEAHLATAPGVEGIEDLQRT